MRDLSLSLMLATFCLAFGAGAGAIWQGVKMRNAMAQCSIIAESLSAAPTHWQSTERFDDQRWCIN